MVSCGDWGSEVIRKNKDESPGPDGKATEPQDSALKVSDKGFKRVTGSMSLHRHSLWGEEMLTRLEVHFEKWPNS